MIPNQQQLDALNCTLGCDVSRYQTDVDWKWMKDNNFSFVFVQSTQGNAIFEGDHYDLVARCKDIIAKGLKLGYYHFCRPNTQGEADFIKSKLKLLPPTDFPLMLDVETSGYTKDYITQYLGNLIDTLNIPIILYSYTDYINRYIDLSFKDNDLWIACYSPKLIMPIGWNDWKIWQCGDQDKPNNVQMDIDVMNIDFFNKF